MSVHTHPKERQREPLIVVGFKIVEITLKTAIEACYIVAAIGKDFSYFPRSTILEHNRLRQFDLWARF